MDIWQVGTCMMCLNSRVPERIGGKLQPVRSEWWRLDRPILGAIQPWMKPDE
jgi:hypothetical protein